MLVFHSLLFRAFVAEKGADEAGSGVAHSNIGLCHGLLGDYSRAAKHHQEALRVALRVQVGEGFSAFYVADMHLFHNIFGRSNQRNKSLLASSSVSLAGRLVLDRVDLMCVFFCCLATTVLPQPRPAPPPLLPLSISILRPSTIPLRRARTRRVPPLETWVPWQ